ncbi:MAG: hypothetical protein LIO92_05495 [Clostridiales bacterium]|nr:hypothetical protein [Clostridiales bacterium]
MNQQEKQNLNSGSGNPLTQEEFHAMMEEIRASNETQAKYARKQYQMSVLSALASFLALAVVCLACVWILPKVNQSLSDLNVIMGDLKVITSELAEADIGGMIADVEDLITSSGDSMNEAMGKLNEIDIEKLNQAISNLSDAVEPLATFFNRFR